MLETILNFLGIAIWPTLLVVFFWPARRPLAELIRNLRKGKATLPGVALELELAAEQQQAPPINPLTAEGLPTHFPALAPKQATIVGIAKERLAKTFGDLPKEQQFPMLIEALARERVFALYEFIYGRIFGSQLRLLERMRAVNGATEDEVLATYTQAQTANEEVFNTFPFGSWIGFLLRVGVVEKIEDRYHLNTFGDGFLAYLEQSQLSKFKSF